MAAADLDTLLTAEIPDGRQNLLDSFTNLERVAEYCENNYYQCPNKRAALEETKGYTTQSLASVAYQINTLAYNFLQMLDLLSGQLSEMESQVNHISQTVAIHKEKVARREIGILTTNKSTARQYKIIAPASPERSVRYQRKPIDYNILDHVGHGVQVAQSQQQVHTHYQANPQPRQSTSQYGPGQISGSQYAPGMGGTYGTLGSAGNVVAQSVGPAPTTKPPTPPQAARYSSGGTLNRSKEYRTPPVVNPPQVPSNYAPNYPQQVVMQQQQQQPQQQQQQRQRQQQYGTLPHAHPQVQMVHPVQQHLHGEHTMPRLSSSSMRSNSSQSSGMDGSPYSAQNTSTPARPISNQVQFNLQGTPGNRQSATPPSQYAPGSAARPTHRPPSPPLPPPPVSQVQQNPQQQSIYARQVSDPNNSIYARQLSAANIAASAAEAVNSMYARQLSRQTSQPSSGPPPGLSRQTSHASTIGGASDLSGVSALPHWVPKNYLERVSAIYDYAADKEDELTFSEGSIIYVLKKNDDGWWEGIMNGVTGLFPGNYVEATL